jgi:SAM-dependent methyltransferase
MAYFDWHEQPGYFRDVTRHFARSDKLLDVGCGSAWLADHFDDYTGIDASADAAARAAERGRNVITVDRVGYESVMPGIGLISQRTKRKQRPRLLAASAWLPIVRRNVWVLARRSP